MPVDPATAVLGDTRGMNPIADLQDFHTGLMALAGQTQRYLKVFSQTLSHELYDLHAFSDRLSDTITERQKLKVRILVRDPSELANRGHRLVALYQRLPSFIAINRFPEEARLDREEYAIFDDIGIIKRYPRAEMKGFYEFRTSDAAVKARQFDALWEKSEPCQELQTVRV